MSKTDLNAINEMEQEIVEFLKKKFGNNLVSLLIEGSYGIYDHIDGYSDYDLLVFVKNTDLVKSINLNRLSDKYSIEIQCSVKSYDDFINRIKNNSRSTRFVGNIDLLIIKNNARLLAGKNILKVVPSIKQLISRDLGSELRADYYHATNLNPQWNIYNREPRKWANYIINLSNNLLVGKGVFVKKGQITRNLRKYCPEFKGIKYVGEAIELRSSKGVLNLNKVEKEKFKKVLTLFLEDYRLYTFFKIK